MNRRLSRNEKIFLSVFLILILTSVLLNSRALMLGYCAGFSFILTVKRYVKSVWVLVAITTLTIFLCYFIKHDSTLGRVLIYKISFGILRDHFWTGVGWNRFSWNYLAYQCDYFKYTDYSIKELLLADNTKHCFNDYLEFVIECGAMGIILLLGLTMLGYKSVTRSLYHHQNSIVINLAVLNVVSLVVSAMFTHMFERPLFQYVFFASLIVVIFSSKLISVSRRVFAVITISGLFSLTAYNYADDILNQPRNRQLEEVHNSFKAGFINDSKEQYDSLYPTYHNNIFFLSDYSNVLIVTKDYQKAEAVLKHLTFLDHANFYFERLAFCYAKNNKLEEAEQAYLTAIHTVPNRFKPRYSLFNFYIKNNLNEKALQCGSEILRLPIKIPSAEVERMRLNVAIALKNLRFCQ